MMRHLHLCSSTKSIQYLLLLVFGVFLLSACDGGSSSNSPDSVDDTTPPSPPTAPTVEGFNSLFMGHSFFRPMAEEMPFHAETSGITGHTQWVEFSGGETGAPLALWNDAGHRASVQAVLDTGTVELFGMTYATTYPTTEGYELWLDYALSKNPDTKFFIALPWRDFPSEDTAEAYANSWQSAHDGPWHDFIDELRALYPNIEIFCIPHGQATLELFSLFEAGNLPDISVLTGVAGEGLFRDYKGHGHTDEILYDTMELVWLNAIYGVELDEYALDPGYITDIKVIAKSIMDAHDPTYNKQFLTNN